MQFKTILHILSSLFFSLILLLCPLSAKSQDSTSTIVPTLALLLTDDATLGTKTPPPNLLNETDEIAAALAGSSKVNLGVWSLLSRLGVGVYTASGEHVMDGSETNEQDFWLYDFEVPLLVRMALKTPYPFTSYYYMLSAWGLPADLDSKEALLALYRDTYSAYPDDFLPMLFSYMGLDFTDGSSITPLQEWLLILDTFIPPNGSQTSQELLMLPNVKASSTGVCDNIISRIKSNSLWGLVSNARNLADDFSNPISIIDLIHSAILHVGVETSLTLSQQDAHEGHDGKIGDSVEFIATAKFVFDFPDKVIECGKMAGISLPKDGPVPPMRVDWDIPTSLAPAHGTLKPGGVFTITESDGTTSQEFTAKTEAANGVGSLEMEFNTITATYNIQQALGNYFSIGGALQEIFNRRKESVVLSLVWHEAPGLYFSWDYEAMPGLRDSGLVSTCNYPSGPWTGDAYLLGTTTVEGAAITFDMSGPVSFEFPAEPDILNKYYAETTVVMTGSQTISVEDMAINCSATYNREYSFTLNEQSQNVKIILLGTTGTVNCMGSSRPISETGTVDTLKPLMPYDQCSD